MRFLLLLFVGSVFSMVVSASASSAPVSVPITKSELDRYAADYFVFGNFSQAMTFRAQPSRRCEDEDDGPSCVDVACDKLGAFGCDSISEVREVGEVCRGNRSGGCLDVSCSLVGHFGCDSISEIKEIAGACRGDVRRDCVESVCGLLGVFGCDSASEIREVATSCRGVSGSCIESVCSRIGTFGCDTISEVREVAASCRGE